ncbi:MAG TPA: type II toxin-antitoxin system RelE/ParE family toxin [Pyrinomonadaceae bacterium]|nr:type II toxin-antitoxin system RelE/ParE family toxin [Pyrinomonadaceae bacterium]
MAHLVIWSPRAIDDVETIAGYIALDSESYAASVVRTILEKARRLSDFPSIGRVVPEFGDDAIREIFAYSYRIIYRVHAQEITIAAVIHGKRILEMAVNP